MPVTITNLRIRIRVQREANVGFSQEPAKAPRNSLQYLDGPALSRPEPVDTEERGESLDMDRRAEERPSAQEVSDRIYDMIMQEARHGVERGGR